MHKKTSIYSKRVVCPDGVMEATVVIDKGVIVAIHRGYSPVAGSEVLDFSDLVLMPGLVDPHVHINDPGRASWEGFETATAAAAAGGVTTLVDMPLNATPVTTTASAFDEKLQACQGKLSVNCGFWGGLVPGNTADILPLAKRGVLGFKAFLAHSGIDDFPNVSEEELAKAYAVLHEAKLNLPVLAHCELTRPHKGEEVLQENPTSYQAYLGSRPKSWEDEAILVMIDLAEKYKVRTHIVHLSAASSIPNIARAKQAGLPLTVETCPHYLFFNAEEIPAKATQYKCAPPIREKANNALLWEALQQGLFSFIGTDHSPAPPEIKAMESGDFAKAWGGIASIQLLLPAFFTKAATYNIGLLSMCKLLSEQAAEFIGFGQRKGKIQVGFDADLMAFDPHETFILSEKDILFKHKHNPYLGIPLKGKVKATFVGGILVWDGKQLLEKSQGQVLFGAKKE